MSHRLGFSKLLFKRIYKLSDGPMDEYINRSGDNYDMLFKKEDKLFKIEETLTNREIARLIKNIREGSFSIDPRDE